MTRAFPKRKADEKMSRKAGIQQTIIIATILIVVLLLWEALSRASVINPILFSSPSRIWSSFVSLNDAGVVWGHVAVTLQELVLSMLIVVVFGGTLGVVLGLGQLRFRVFYGPISVLFSFPKVTLIPVFIAAFGLGMESKVLFGAFIGIFPVITGMMVATRGIGTIHRDLFKTIGASFPFTLRRLIIPATIVPFVSSLRVGFVYCGIGVLLAEMSSSYAGLGGRIISAGSQATMDNYWVYVVLSSAIIVIGYGACRLIEVAMGRGKEGARA